MPVYSAINSFTFAWKDGSTSSQRPTTPHSECRKMGASGSLLMAMMCLEKVMLMVKLLNSYQ